MSKTHETPGLQEPVLQHPGARPLAGAAIAACVLGLAALGTVVFSPLAGVLAVLALAGGLYSRSLLRRDPALRGARLSLLGVLLGSLVLAILAFPWALSLLLTLVSGGSSAG